MAVPTPAKRPRAGPGLQRLVTHVARVMSSYQYSQRSLGGTEPRAQLWGRQLLGGTGPNGPRGRPPLGSTASSSRSFSACVNGVKVNALPPGTVFACDTTTEMAGGASLSPPAFPNLELELTGTDGAASFSAMSCSSLELAGLYASLGALDGCIVAVVTAAVEMLAAVPPSENGSLRNSPHPPCYPTYLASHASIAALQL